uniref:SWIM-type domain-containing protein n=1 Tax=Lactuca sativa TaxID=4236 RepID=A0A9R1VSJ3_LACSA|nr:hypothetical protein LSAT_V11C400206000 [Lactuca sativa]
MSHVSQRSNVIDVNEGLIMGHIEEVCKGNLGNLAEEPISEDIDGQQSVRLDEFEAFTDDYSTYAEFDVEYSVPNDMSEFQSVVDVDEHGILNKQHESIGNDIVDEELEVIQSDDYQYAGFNEDERTKMVKHLIQCGGPSTRSNVKCKGQSTETVQCGGPSTRSKVKCKGKNVISNKGKCPWVVQISRPDENTDWLVKTVHDVYKCLQTRSVKACTSKYLANLIVQQIQSNPKIPIKALHEELCKKLELGMSVQKVDRAKQMAERVISGDYQLQYGYLRDYALELLNTNPGSTVRIDVYPEPSLSTTTRTFRRIYVCLGALKLGFRAGLRDFLGVDGTLLKGPYPGQVLTAVGLDSNNGIYPVAYAVVEAETTSCWTWFTELLGEDLELGANSNFTFISDRQKGIIPAVAKVFPNAEHRDKPIITCLEYIREYLMKRLCVVQKEINKCQGELSTTTTIIIEEIKTQAAKYVAKYNGAGKYQVASTWQDQYVVNLNERSCTCRFWEIIGFPCRHAVSAIRNKIENGEDAPDVEDRVHPCYKLSTWRAMYLNKIDPINGRLMRPKNDCPFTLTPPKHHTQVGRPKKKRRRSVDEPNSQTTKLSRKFIAVTCSKCHNKGHNSRTCKGQGGISEVGSKGKTQGKGMTQAKGKTQGKGKGNLGNSVK